MTYKHAMAALAISSTLALCACSSGGAGSAPVIQGPLTGARNAVPTLSPALIYACYTNHHECLWFERGHARVKGQITGLDFPVALAVDRSQNVYVADQDAHEVLVYARGSTTLLRTLSDPGFSTGVAVAADGTVYVSNADPGEIVVYAPGSSTISQTISDPSIAYLSSVALDEHQGLFACGAAQGTYIHECVSFPNRRAPSKVIYRGLFAYGLAFDAIGDVALATKDGTKYLSPTFIPCGFDGTGKQRGIAFDRQSGDIFTAFPYGGNIVEKAYTPCTGNNIEYVYNTGTRFGNHPDSVAVDPGSGI